jgi:hypothetical protein
MKGTSSAKHGRGSTSVAGRHQSFVLDVGRIGRIRVSGFDTDKGKGP